MDLLTEPFSVFLSDTSNTKFVEMSLESFWIRMAIYFWDIWVNQLSFR